MCKAFHILTYLVAMLYNEVLLLIMVIVSRFRDCVNIAHTYTHTLPTVDESSDWVGMDRLMAVWLGGQLSNLGVTMFLEFILSHDLNKYGVHENSDS